MSNGERKLSTLAVASHGALCLTAANSLAARARTDLRNREEAAKWLERGIEHETRGEWIKARECFEQGLLLDPGDCKLQNLFALALQTDADGVSVSDPSTDQLVRMWVLKCAEQGSMWAQVWLWSSHEKFWIENAQAAVWMHKAAEQGNHDSVWALSGVYLSGDGVTESDVEASFWIELYALLLQIDGYRTRSDDEQTRQYLSSKLSQEELAAINQRVAGWLSRAVLGNPESQFNLGNMYYQGRSVPQNYPQAAAWFRKAADQAYAPAEFNLGWLYHLGRGVDQNDIEASVWFLKAATLGLTDAQINLGIFYSRGNGVSQNYAEAYYWLNLAASTSAGADREKAAKWRDEAAAKLSPAELQSVQARAADWFASHQPSRQELSELEDDRAGQACAA
jgi:TPR repeat protein